jgi:hypothetical protein
MFFNWALHITTTQTVLPFLAFKQTNKQKQINQTYKHKKPKQNKQTKTKA